MQPIRASMRNTPQSQVYLCSEQEVLKDATRNRGQRAYPLLSRWFSFFLLLSILLGQVLTVQPVQASASLSVTPITWNVLGLDSNDVTTGPNRFPVGARVCNSGDSALTNITSTFNWTSSDGFIDLRAGTKNAYLDEGINLAPTECTDFYYEVEITRDATAYGHTRLYTITASADGDVSGSTPTPREIYVERLISQSRNAVSNVKLDGVSIPSGGSMVLTVGNTYTIELDGSTATNGYNQLESFINFPNTIFQILSVSTSYDVSTTLGSPTDLLYADSCGWDNNPKSPTYRSCIKSDGKAGGDVVTVYEVKIIGGGGTDQSLSTLLYDFSGSSFHYNSDFSTSARMVSIVDPNQVTISKAFSPAATVAGGSSTLIFTLTNPTPSTITGVNFTDDLPTSPGAMKVSATANAMTSGCGTPVFAPTAGASSLTFSNGTIAPNSTCTISVSVTVPSSPTEGTYTNTTGHVYINDIDTGNSATASLGLTTSSGGTGMCGLTLAKWTMSSGTNGDTTPPAASTKASDVSTATASYGQGLTGEYDPTAGNPAGSLLLFGWQKSSPITINSSAYYQFAIDTSHYSQVVMSFDTERKANGPTSVFVYTSTDGTTWTQDNTTAINPSTTAFGSFSTKQTNGTGITYYRIYGYGANATSQGNDLYIDNIAFTGCGAAQPPSITKTFKTNPVAVGGTSQLSFTLTNSNSVSLNGVQFTDALPSGVEVAATPAANASNCGSPTFNPSAGATSLTFSNGTIAAGGTCTVDVNVKVTTSGPHLNISGTVSSTESGTNMGSNGTATASVIGLLPPIISVQFSPNPVLINGTSTLTFTIQNPNPDNSLPGVAFNNAFPTSPGSMTVASTPNATTLNCGTPTYNPTAGANSISFSNGTIPAGGSCTVSVDVTAPVEGEYLDTTGTVSATVSSVQTNGNSASDTLNVTLPHPGITLLKQVSDAAGGPWSNFVVVAPNTGIYYRLTVENTGDVPVSNLVVDDAGLDLSGCSWPASLPVASPTQEPTAECTVGPIPAQLGDTLNTAAALGSYGGSDYLSISTAEYVGANPGLNLVQQVSTSTNGPWSSDLTGVLPGSDLYYKFTVINSGELPLSNLSITTDIPGIDLSGCDLTDPLDQNGATFCIAGPIAAETPIGVYTNTSTVSGENSGTTTESSPSASSYTTLSPDLTVAIANDTGGTGVGGEAFTWTVTVDNQGDADAVFTSGQKILSNPLPVGPDYGSPSIVDTNGVTGNIACTVEAGTLTCSADGADVTVSSGGYFSVAYTVTPHNIGSWTDNAVVDPDGNITESLETNNAASDTVAVDTISADLSIDVTDGQLAFQAGDTITYTITVRNIGLSDVTGATVTDTFPTNLTAVSWTCVATDGSCTSSGTGDINDSAVDLIVHGTAVYTVTATVIDNPGMTLVDMASVSLPSEYAEVDLSDNTQSDTDNLAAIEVSVISDRTTVLPGTTITYTYTIINQGNSALSEISLADPDCSPITGPVGDTNTDTLLDTTETWTYSCSAARDTTITDTVTASAKDLDGNALSATDQTTVTVSDTTYADLVIQKTNATHNNAYVGTGFTWTLTATNSGNADAVFTAGQLVLSDALPAGASYDSFTVVDLSNITPVENLSCGIAGYALTCTAINGPVTIQSGGSITLTYQATASSTGELINSASIDPDGWIDESNESNNAATDTVSINTPVVDLSISQTVDLATVDPGGIVTFTIVVANGGPSAADGSSLTVPPVSGITLTGVSCGAETNGAACPTSGNTVSDLQGSGIVIPTFPPGSSLTFTATATITAENSSLVNVATITAPESVSEPDTTNNSASASVSVNPGVVDLTLTLSNNAGGSIALGASFTWTVTIENNGSADANFGSGEYILYDGLPSTASYSAPSVGNITGITSLESMSCDISSDILRCIANDPGVTIDAGGSFTVSFDVTPSASGSITYAAMVDHFDVISENDETNNTDSDTVTITAPVVSDIDLLITLTDNVSLVNTNDVVTYEVVLSNSGPSDGSGASFTSAAAAGVSVSNVSCITAALGAACPTSGIDVSHLQGSGIVLSTFPSGSSLTFEMTATITASASSLTKTVNIIAPQEVTETDEANNTASDTDSLAQTTTFRLFLPMLERNFQRITQTWGLTLGYEDLPLLSGGNDYDYNDWVVRIDPSITYALGTVDRMEEMTLSFVPEARGATYDTEFHVKFAAGVFSSNGTATLTTYDSKHAVLATQSMAFVAGQANDYVIFPKISTVFPGTVINTVEGSTPMAPQRYAELKIAFDAPVTFTVDESSLGSPHGDDLFFDPYLAYRSGTGQIHTGDIRLLSIPSGEWAWPEEGYRIDWAYPSVGYTKGLPPVFSFPADWWKNHNRCVYDGVHC